MPAQLVWIVDDSPLEAELVRRVLASRFEVEVFRTGASVLERLAPGHLPDALVLDWRMPDVSGLDVCKFVRKATDRSSLPILVLTGSEDEAVLVEALEAGANDFVTKPCSPAVLTARMDALMESKVLAQQLRQEATMRERFIGILGHDLRQPLHTLTVSTELLRLANLEERAARNVERAASAARRMQRMIADILDLTRTRGGQALPIVLQRADLRDVCATVVEEIRVGHPTVRVKLSASGDTVGLFDADRVTQMCSNLIMNAIEHGREGEPIGLTLDGAGGEVVVRVENQGEPINPTLQPGLFDAFRRGQKQGGEGLGLGLFIVREVARGHGGRVIVESDASSTRFIVPLPRGPEIGLRPSPGA